MKRFWNWTALCFLLVLFAGCNRSEELHQLQGTLLIWHTWPAPHGEMLTTSLNSFREVNPGVSIVSEYVADDELLERFVDQAAAGLGPDLIVGVTPAMVRELAGRNLLVDLDRYEPDAADLPNRAVDALRVREALFGLPIAAYTQVLFYNKRSAERAPQTLPEVLDVARSGQIFAFPAGFRHSFWGIRGFGGEMDFNGRQATITEGLGQWLQWLQRAQKEPNMILSDDPDELYELFASGRATFYIGKSIQLPRLRERLGDDVVGVAYLPVNAEPEPIEEEAESPPVEDLYGAIQPPGAFLELEVAALSRMSSRKKLALQLVLFLANPVHQRRLASSDLGHVPINQRVRFDHRLSASETTIVRQSSTAIIVPLQDITDLEQLSDIADGVYAQVLEGVLEPEEAVLQIQEELRLESEAETEQQ